MKYPWSLKYIFCWIICLIFFHLGYGKWLIYKMYFLVRSLKRTNYFIWILIHINFLSYIIIITENVISNCSNIFYLTKRIILCVHKIGYFSNEFITPTLNWKTLPHRNTSILNKQTFQTFRVNIFIDFKTALMKWTFDSLLLVDSQYTNVNQVVPVIVPKREGRVLRTYTPLLFNVKYFFIHLQFDGCGHFFRCIGFNRSLQLFDNLFNLAS